MELVCSRSGEESVLEIRLSDHFCIQIVFVTI